MPLTVLYDVMKMRHFNRFVKRKVTILVLARLTGTNPESCAYNEI